MNKTLKWILIGLAIVVGAFLVAMPIFMLGLNHGALRTGGFGFSRHMPGMMFPFGGLFMLFRMLIPLGIFVLAVFGVIHLVRGKATTTQAMVPPAQSVAPAVDVRQCTSCGKTYESDGEYCPYCGTKR